MKAIVATEPGKVEILDIPKPRPGPYQALAKNRITSLCNATDRKLIEGHFPGHENFPIVLGHEGVAVVEELGEKVRNFKIGDHVISGMLGDFGNEMFYAGWGGFCEYVVVHDHEAMVADGADNEENGWFDSCEVQTVVADDIPLEEAALLCTWREVLGGFGDFHLVPGNDILIFGAGPVGLSFVKFARLLGMNWIGVVELNATRHDKIRTMGADAVFLPKDVPSIRESRPPLDAVIDAVGNPSIVNMSLPLIKLGGSMCIYGVLSENDFVVDKSSGPYNFNLFVHQWPTRFRERTAQEPLCDWIRAGALKAEDFVTHRYPFERIGEALAESRKGTVIKCLLTY